MLTCPSGAGGYACEAAVPARQQHSLWAIWCALCDVRVMHGPLIWRLVLQQALQSLCAMLQTPATAQATPAALMALRATPRSATPEVAGMDAMIAV
jgi:hypothetical protein